MQMMCAEMMYVARGASVNYYSTAARVSCRVVVNRQWNGAIKQWKTRWERGVHVSGGGITR